MNNTNNTHKEEYNMARITEATRELLRKKILEKSQDKRDALDEEMTKLSDSLDAEDNRYKARAVALIKREFEVFEANVKRIMGDHRLKFKKSCYSGYPQTVEDIIGDNRGEAFIKDDAGDKMERIKDSKDHAVKRLDRLRADLKELDGKRRKACEDIELRVALGAKFDEVVELINNLQF